MMIRLATIGIGYGMLTLGVIGLIVPVLHGAIFFVIGLLILSRHAAWAERWLDWLKRRHPKVEQMIQRGQGIVDRGERWLAVRLGRLFGSPPAS
jgi:uncharacterized membrane protein YbaN (DUF454 family)